MLILTRSVGESIRIGEDIQLAIRSKLRGHIGLTLAAPAGVSIRDDTGAQLRQIRLCAPDRRYRIEAMVGDYLRLGEDIVVWFAPNPASWSALWRGRQVRIGIDAPRSVPVHREEIFRRIREAQMTFEGDAVSAEFHQGHLGSAQDRA